MQGISLQRRELLPRRRSEINGPISLRPPRRRTDQASTTLDGLAYEEWPALQERIASGARALAGQMRALQQRYEEEHRRLADSLEFLAVQSRDLERELVAFGRLAESLASEVGPGAQ